ncbi:MAG: alpha/beta hydrolase, partial [Porticoccaceae bacterium]|nr:alpha/beta hydrolase [Porticoccaceae bacterium]
MKQLLLCLLLAITPLANAEYSRTFLDTHPLKTIGVNGIDIAYRTVGEGADRPKIVVIMGLGGSN